MRDYQIADLAYYIANPKCMNLSDPGTGKTPSVCVYQQYLWEHCQVRTAWVQPKGLMEKNRRELLRFTDFKPDDIVIVDGSPAQVKAALASDAKVFLMGPRRWTLSWKGLPSDCTALIVDEQQKCFKRPESAATQSMMEAFRSKRFTYYLAMTGTLVSGSLDTAYPAIAVIEPRYYVSYKHFMTYHGVYNFEGKLIGFRNHDKISRILGTHAIRRTFSEIYGDQEIVYQTQYASMTDRQRELFETFKEDAVLELEKFYLTGTEPGVAFIRARQIQETPNRIPDLTSPGDTVDILEGELPGKLQLLTQHLEDHHDLNQPCLVFTPMVQQQNQLLHLAREVGLRTELINGSVSMKERDDINVKFDNGELDCIICSPECADVGLNLQWSGGRETAHVIFVSSPYLDDTCLQAIRRAVRGKRESPLRVTFMAYEDSLDQRIFSILKRKSVDAHLVDPNRPVLDL